MGITVTLNPDGTYTTTGEADTPAPLWWDAFDFKKRFTVEERIAIRAAAASSGAVYDFLDMLDTAGMTGTRIIADDELLNAAMAQLTQAGLLDPGRAEAILGQEIHIPV